ncbi:MAG: PqqD family protein [Firmicutes bacterium]|nr:PqqD family protein [Bacillota bacterium]
MLCEEFEVSPERALQDCRTLVSQMRQAGWIE